MKYPIKYLEKYLRESSSIRPNLFQSARYHPHLKNYFEKTAMGNNRPGLLMSALSRDAYLNEPFSRTT